MEQLKKLQYLQLVNKITAGGVCNHGWPVADVAWIVAWEGGHEAAMQGAGMSCCRMPALGCCDLTRLLALLPALPLHHSELENHLQISEKAVAEFIIDMAKDKANVDQFKKVRLTVCVDNKQTICSVALQLNHDLRWPS